MSDFIIESIGSWGVKATKSAHRLTTPKSGDVVDFGEFEGMYPFTNGRYGRIWTLKNGNFGNSLCCEMGSAHLFESGNVDISGGPFAGFDLADLETTYTLRPANFWNWGNNSIGAGMGVDYIIARPVFRLVTLHGKTPAQYKES